VCDFNFGTFFICVLKSLWEFGSKFKSTKINIMLWNKLSIEIHTKILLSFRATEPNEIWGWEIVH
jgi:hypothetical protein